MKFPRVGYLIICGLIVILLGNLAYFLFPDVYWVHNDFHASLEATGAVFAFLLIILILRIRKYDTLDFFYVWVLCGLTAMGLLDLLHSFVDPGESFVWLHSTAVFIGGVLFAMVWIPEGGIFARYASTLHRDVFIATLIFGIISVMLPGLVPGMLLEEGGFTPLASGLNVAGGACFLASSAWFFKGHIKKGSFDELLFALLSLLFGVGGLLFYFSKLWDVGWWLWHGVRMAAYIIAIYYAFSIYSQLTTAVREERDRAQKYLDVAASALMILDTDQNMVMVNRKGCEILGYDERDMIGRNWFDTFLPGRSRGEARSLFNNYITGETGQYEYSETPVVNKQGEERILAWRNSLLKDEAGNITGVLRSGEDITERKKAEEELNRIKWLLRKSIRLLDTETLKGKYLGQSYGNLAKLNTCRVVLDSVTEGMLVEIMNDYLELLDTSSAVYEVNGDYAAGLFSSGWCRFLDAASRGLCETGDNREALAGGKWLCHESCWTGASKVAIHTGRPVDIECSGGINLYAVPIWAGPEIVGSINFGYGDPPKDYRTLRKIADRYGVGIDRLSELSLSYSSRPPFIINVAKRRLKTSAKLIGEIIERVKAEDKLQKAKDELEIRVEERTSDLKKLNMLLEEERDKFQRYLDIAAVMVVMLDSNQRVILINKKGCEILGYKEEEIVGKNWFDHYLPRRLRDKVKSVFAKLISGDIDPAEYYENEVLTRDGRERMIAWYNTVFRDETGKIIATLGAGGDITEQKNTQNALRISEERFRRAFETASIGMALVSPDGHWLRVNTALCKIIGYSEEELLSMTLQEITHPHDLEADLNYMRQMLTGEIRHCHAEKRHIHKTGNILWVMLNISLVRDENGVPLHFILQIQDITDRKKAENDIQDSLKEKEVLLKEIHHRVKNNMAVISSLLKLQADKISNTHYREIFNDSMNRIKSMAMIHEKFYRTKDLARIIFSDYISDVVDNMYMSYGLSDGRIELVKDMEKVIMGIDTAIPCGLIVNELVSNALKYAFPGERRGKIEVVIRRNEKGEIELAVIDDGQGMPPDMDFRNTDSLGLSLVNALVMQIQGAVELDTAKGTGFRITFQGRE